MEMAVRRILRLGLAVLLTVSAWSGFDVASTQDTASERDIAEATGFVEDWTLSMRGPEGSFEMSLSIKDVGGKVAAELTSEVQGTQAITDISKSGDGLVLEYQSGFQEQALPVVLTLMPDGDGLKVAMAFAGGRFTMDGTGKK